MLKNVLFGVVAGTLFGCGNTPSNSGKGSAVSSKSSQTHPAATPSPAAPSQPAPSPTSSPASSSPADYSPPASPSASSQADPSSPPSPPDSLCAAPENVRLFGKVRKAKDVKSCYGRILYDRYGGEDVFSAEVATKTCKDDGYLGYAFQLLCNDAGGLVVDFGCGPGDCTVRVERSSFTCAAAREAYTRTKEKLATLAAPKCEADTDCAMFQLMADPAECVSDAEVLIGFQQNLVGDLANTAQQSLTVTYMCIDEIKSGWCSHPLEDTPKGQCDGATKTCRQMD